MDCDFIAQVPVKARKLWLSIVMVLIRLGNLAGSKNLGNERYSVEKTFNFRRNSCSNSPLKFE